MAQYSAIDGTVGDYHLMHLGARAMGGAALVFAEMTCVSADARITPRCAGMYTPEHTAAWRRIVGFIHANSDAKAGIQLGHAGAKGSTRVMWEGIDQPLAEGNWPLVAASGQQYLEGVSQTARAARRRVWRQPGEPLPLSAAGAARHACGVAARAPDQRAHLGARLGRRRHHARRRGADRAAVQGCRRRPDRRFVRPGKQA
jgi:hypothetical protein